MRGSERLTVAFLLALSAAAALAALRAPGRGWLPLAFAAQAGATVLLARLGPRSPRWAIARDLLPALVVLATFSLLQGVIEPLVPWRLDGALGRFDARWLGGVVEAWHGFLGRPAGFTDAAYVAYFSFYVIPLAAVFRARTGDGPGGYERAALPVLASFYASWVGYFLFPALGPRLAPEAERALLGGGAISEAVRAFLHAAEATTLDAFPSGHTAVSLVAAAVAPKATRVARLAWWGWGASIVFATVYIHVHYVADVIAGLLLALAVLWLTGLGGAPGRASDAPRTL